MLGNTPISQFQLGKPGGSVPFPFSALSDHSWTHKFIYQWVISPILFRALMLDISWWIDDFLLFWFEIWSWEMSWRKKFLEWKCPFCLEKVLETQEHYVMTCEHWSSIRKQTLGFERSSNDLEIAWIAAALGIEPNWTAQHRDWTPLRLEQQIRNSEKTRILDSRCPLTKNNRGPKSQLFSGSHKSVSFKASRGSHPCHHLNIAYTSWVNCREIR